LEGALKCPINESQIRCRATTIGKSIKKCIAMEANILSSIKECESARKDNCCFDSCILTHTPISVKRKYFKRVLSSNLLMDLNGIANEHLKTMNLSWDLAPDVGHGIADIALETVNRFIEVVNQYWDYLIMDNFLTVLKKFELLYDNSITFGCLLFFCKESSMSGKIDAGSPEYGGVTQLLEFIYNNPDKNLRQIKSI
jgi:predicted HTH transcriptional regulator